MLIAAINSLLFLSKWYLYGWKIVLLKISQLKSEPIAADNLQFSQMVTNLKKAAKIIQRQKMTVIGSNKLLGLFIPKNIKIFLNKVKFKSPNGFINKYKNGNTEPNEKTSENALANTKQKRKIICIFLCSFNFFQSA